MTRHEAAIILESLAVPVGAEAAMDMAIEALRSDTARDIATIIENEQDMRVMLNGSWTPVTEAMPDDGEEVWVTIKGHDVIYCEPGETMEQAIDRISKVRWVTRAYWCEEEHGWNDPSFGCPMVCKPIAWMPLNVPEPYKGGQDGRESRTEI